jgi:hypothetical protein
VVVSPPFFICEPKQGWPVINGYGNDTLADAHTLVIRSTMAQVLHIVWRGERHLSVLAARSGAAVFEMSPRRHGARLSHTRLAFRGRPVDRTA